MPAATVQLHDVRDAEAFVAAVAARILDRHNIRLGHHDREDLHAEGLEIMLQLARAYTPSHAAKRDEWATFSGYAAGMLPNRLMDVLRRRGSRPRRPDGSRGWVPRNVVSLDVVRERPGWDERATCDWRGFTAAA